MYVYVFILLMIKMLIKFGAFALIIMLIIM